MTELDRGQAAGTDGASGGDEVVAPPRGGILLRIATYAPGSLVPAALTLVTSMVFTRVFSAAAFGTYSMFLVVANPVKLVLTTWLSQSIGKFLPSASTVQGRQEAKEAIFCSTMVIIGVESVLGVGAFAVAYPLLPSGQRGLLLPMVAFVVVTSLFEILGTVFAAEHRAKDYVSYKLIDSVVTFGLRLLLVSALINMDIRLMFWSVVLSNLVLIPFMWARSGLLRPSRILRAMNTPHTRRLTWAFVRFGVPMTLWFLSSILLDVGDRYVINYLLGKAPVGVYDANYRLIAGSAALLVVPITMTLHPYLMSVSARGDAEHIGKVIGTIVENLLIVGVLAVGLTWVFHTDIALIMLGAEFREGSVVMPLVLAGVFFFNIGTFVHKPFEIQGRPGTMVAFGAISAVANLVFCFVLIPPYGIVGAAYATLLAYLLYPVGVGVLGRRIFPWRIDLRRTLTHGALTCGGLALLWMVRGTMLERLPYWADLSVSVLAAGALAGVSLLAVLKRRSPEAEREIR